MISNINDVLHRILLGTETRREGHVTCKEINA